MIKYLTFMALSRIFLLITPILVKKLIDWTIDKDDKSYKGFLYAFLVCLVFYLGVMLAHLDRIILQKSKVKLGNVLAVRFNIKYFYITFLGTSRSKNSRIAPKCK